MQAHQGLYLKRCPTMQSMPKDAQYRCRTHASIAALSPAPQNSLRVVGKAMETVARAATGAPNRSGIAFANTTLHRPAELLVSPSGPVAQGPVTTPTNYPAASRYADPGTPWRAHNLDRVGKTTGVEAGGDDVWFGRVLSEGKLEEGRTMRHTEAFVCECRCCEPKEARNVRTQINAWSCAIAGGMRGRCPPCHANHSNML